MTVVQGRGGFPHVWRETVTHTTGWAHRLPFICSHLQIKVVTNSCKVYFTEADFDADENYILVIPASAEEPHGFEGPVEASTIWLKGVTGSSAVELVAYQRRG